MFIFHFNSLLDTINLVILFLGVHHLCSPHTLQLLVYATVRDSKFIIATVLPTTVVI